MPKTNFKVWLTNNTGSDEYDSIVPEWSIYEGGEDIINLADGRDPTRKTLSCKKLGWTYVIVSAECAG